MGVFRGNDKKNCLNPLETVIFLLKNCKKNIVFVAKITPESLFVFLKQMENVYLVKIGQEWRGVRKEEGGGLTETYEHIVSCIQDQ